MHSGAYFKIFTSSFCWRLSTQGQLISKSVILLLSLSTIHVSTLLAPTSVWSTYTGTSQKAVMWLFSYIGLGCVGKYQWGTDSISLMTEKIWIEVNLIQWLQIHVVLNHLYLQCPWLFTCPSLTSVEKYRIYSINRPGRLLNFWTLRVGAYSRLGAY